MERLLVILLILATILVAGMVLRVYGTAIEPFVLNAVRNPRTKNPTGRYSDEPKEGRGFFHCKDEGDTSPENASLPTCSEMRRGMIQKARDEGQIPEIPPTERAKYPATDDSEVVGSIGFLQVVLNRAAHESRHRMCVPFVDCDRYVNPETRRLYCPVGMLHSTDSKGDTIGCHSFPENVMLNCEIATSLGDGRVACSVLENIQTVGPGFKMYPPMSTIRAVLQSRTQREVESQFQAANDNTEDVDAKQKLLDEEKTEIRQREKNVGTTVQRIHDEKSGIILNIIRSYPGIMSRAEKEAGLDDETANLATSAGMMAEIQNTSKHHLSILSQFMSGLMESYIVYQPIAGGRARVGFIQVPGKTPSIPDLRTFDDDRSGPEYEILPGTFIPDTLMPPAGVMPILTPHKQTNYRPPRPSHPVPTHHKDYHGPRNRSGRKDDGSGDSCHKKPRSVWSFFF